MFLDAKQTSRKRIDLIVEIVRSKLRASELKINKFGLPLNKR